MWRTSHIARCILVAFVAIVSFTILGAATCAQSVDISLNVFYNQPGDTGSAGTWQIVAKASADTAGLSAVSLYFTGINPPSAQSLGPRGSVNGEDPAGFSLVAPFSPLAGVQGITIGQQPVGGVPIPPGKEQSVFYGVGTLTNGSPDFPGKPVGSSTLGPAFTTLTNTSAIPWGTGDIFGEAAWSKSVLLTSGTFAAGQSPAFYSDATFNADAQVFTSVGTSSTIGTRLLVANPTTVVRTNYLPDYNHNGSVDAADYTVWRDSLGHAGANLAADGSHNGLVDLPDYFLWKSKFGQLAVFPGAGSGGSSGGLGNGGAVPEPTSATLLMAGGFFLFLRQRMRVLRNV